MSLLIHDADIHNLYHNGQKIKAAYFDGERVWTEKHRVRWYDTVGNLLKTEWVTDGGAATPPNVTEFEADFYGYQVTGWVPGYDSITADVNISATSIIETAYLFRSGYGINYEMLTNGFDAAISAYDSVSKMAYTYVKSSTVTTDDITCSFTGSRSSNKDTFRAIRYRAVLLDCTALTAAGYSKIGFSGSYAFGKGETYSTANIRSAFVALQTSNQITTNTANGVVGSLVWEKYLHTTQGNSKLLTVSAVSGQINGSLQLPTSGSYYLIIGGASKAFGGTVDVRINNVWLN